jgi:hypothetical protein
MRKLRWSDLPCATSDNKVRAEEDLGFALLRLLNAVAMRHGCLILLQNEVKLSQFDTSLSIAGFARLRVVGLDSEHGGIG